MLSHDGIYAVATLMANDDSQTEENPADNCDEDALENPRKCYIFCPPGDRASLFAEVDRKTAAPLIPEFQDYVLDSLIARGDLRQMKVLSFTERMEAWSLTLLPEDRNVTDILEQGLKDRRITIPGAVPDAADGFAEVNSVTGYLNAFGVTVADRIRSQFVPKFDPASEPLSEEILEVNDYIHEKAGYSLYDAQLAVTEAVKRQLCQQKMALIVAECGSGKTKLSAAATGALNALKRLGTRKSFNLVMCPSHVTGKWVREIAETLPDTYGMVVKSITDVDRLFDLYQRGDKNVYAVFSKERARDGYMRYPAVLWSRRKRGFVCPDCLGLIEMETSGDGTRYMVPSDQFFFQKEHLANHLCPHCGTPLWAPVNDRRQMPWIKIGGYTNEGRTYPIPAISFFSASNEIPNFADPQEQILAPLYDRLQIKVVTEDISDRDKRLAVLKSKQNGGDGAVNATISLSELYAMQQEVAAILVPDAINELADDVLCELRNSGIEVSDRKYLHYYPLVQAKAWLEGHDKVEPQDLLILKCYLWQAPGDRPTVENTLTRLCVNPLQDKVNSILAMAVEAQEDFNTVVVDGGNPKAGSKALLKLRGELLQLYKRQQELCAAAQSDTEKDMVNKLLNDLETISMAAHNAVNFTYIPLEQMAALQ